MRDEKLNSLKYSNKNNNNTKILKRFVVSDNHKQFQWKTLKKKKKHEYRDNSPKWKTMSKKGKKFETKKKNFLRHKRRYKKKQQQQQQKFGRFWFCLCREKILT